ncbi:FAD-dependent oxidoreductase [Candidatus Micrarchaeota archaeon]|nr:FAD-dependent oxidoreductase [Candidatus Micrarchaeota archaeon]
MPAKQYDVIVIGAGIAGLTAAVYTARAGLRTLVFGRIEQSMLAEGEKVGNYVGFTDVPGIEILRRGLEQAKHYGANHLLQEVVHAKRDEVTKIFTVKSADTREYAARALIIATGNQYKPSGAEGEEKYRGKGVSYCVACDGFFYRNKKVAVIGNSNLAAEEALELTGVTKDITLVSQAGAFAFSKELEAELKKRKIRRVAGVVKEIRGNKRVSSLLLAGGKAIPADAVFIALGSAGASDFSNKLGLIMDAGVLVVDKEMKTSTDGVYAAGSCVGGNVQAAKSAGDGCNAAISVIKLLKGVKTFADQT